MTARLTRLLQPLATAIEARSVRERVLLLLAALGLLTAVGYYGYLAPTFERIEISRNERAQLEAQLTTLEARERALATRPVRDPERQLRDEIVELEERLAQLQAQAAEKTPEFIPPEQMREVLQALLAERPGARLIAFERLPAEPAFAAESEGSESDTPQVFRHALRLVIEADYHATIDYLEAIEQLPWQFAWERLDYAVTEHPRARIELRLHTLSGHRQWLGLY